jgi:hypothetical protein
VSEADPNSVQWTDFPLNGFDDRRGRPVGRTKGGLDTRPHAVTDADGRPLRFFRTAGEVSDPPRAACPPPNG